MGGEIVHHNADQFGVRIMHVGQIAHADGEVARGSMASVILHMAPGPVRIEKHEQIGGAITSIFAIVTFALARLCRTIGSRELLPISCVGLIEANHRMPWIGCFGVEIENVLHTRDMGLRVHLRNAPHVPAPRLQVVLGQTSAHRLI